MDSEVRAILNDIDSTIDILTKELDELKERVSELEDKQDQGAG